MGRHAVAIAVLIVMGTSSARAQDATFVVMTPAADIHKAPSTGSAVMGKATRGKTFEVRRELGSWVSVAWPGGDNGVAYLHVAWGRISRGTPVPAPPATGAGLSVAGPPLEPDALTRDGHAAQPPRTSMQIAQPPRTNTLPPRGLFLPSHVIGLGGRIGNREMGFAATGRAWTYGQLGLQIEAGQSRYSNVAASEQLKSLRLAPSVMYSPPNLVTNAIWARPYVGAGINFHRSTLDSPFSGAEVVDHVVGSHVFGGAEFTWANVPRFVVSADLRQQWTPPTFTGFELGGFGVALSAHWYLK